MKPTSAPVSVKPAAVPIVPPTPLLGSTPSLTKIVPSRKLIQFLIGGGPLQVLNFLSSKTKSLLRILMDKGGGGSHSKPLFKGMECMFIPAGGGVEN